MQPEYSSPKGTYEPTSPLQGRGFKGQVPKIFYLGGIPMVICFLMFQLSTARSYQFSPVPAIIRKAKKRTNSNSVLSLISEQNNRAGDDFSDIASSIQEGALRRIKKTLKGVAKEKEGDRQVAAKELFDNIMSEISNVENGAGDGSLDHGAQAHKGFLERRKYRHDWGPVIKKEWPKSMNITGETKEKVMEILEWEYNILEKEVPFVGDPEAIKRHPGPSKKGEKVDRQYTNSLIVAPFADEQHLHGLVGHDPTTGKRWWKQTEDPKVCTTISEAECTRRLKEGGGFDLEMSNSLELDTIPPINFLKENCMEYVKSIDTSKLPDTSVSITFYNEPVSTLLRTVHSVLNNTPPDLLREIILVDDHSDLESNVAGGALDDAIKYLPKVKILRQPERKGLVMGRIAGIHNSLGKAVVILDSHVEVNQYWLEPMLQRIVEEPKAVVYPFVAGIDQQTFKPITASGIGTWLSWTWHMVEASTYEYPPKDIAPVPSASMAGGLFAVRRDTFFELGAYDEQFAMWGAENVEMPFRVWMCGGRMEGIPCSMTFHIYRKGGVGYKSPGDAIMMNRLRTARMWMDEWYQVARFFLMYNVIDKEKEERIVGDMDEMLTWKEKAKCKNFDWFMKNIDPNHSAADLDDIKLMGELRSAYVIDQCIDLHGAKPNPPGKKDGNFKPNQLIGTYACHRSGASQAFFSAPSAKQKELKDKQANSWQMQSAINPKNCVGRLHTLDADQKPTKDFGHAGIMACPGPKDWNILGIEIGTPPEKLKLELTLEKNENPTKNPRVKAELARIIQEDKNHPEYGKRCLTIMMLEDGNVIKNKQGNLVFNDCNDDNPRQWWWVENRDLKATYEPPQIKHNYYNKD